jgi:hypothetical protein
MTPETLSAAQQRPSGSCVDARDQCSGSEGRTLPEGAICLPNKLVMSLHGPDALGPADWDRCQWPVLQSELAGIATLARELLLGQ